MDSRLNNILQNAKSIYRESIQENNSVIEELSLSIITEVTILNNDENRENFQHKELRRRVRLDDEHSRDVDILAYVFSEYEHIALFPNDTQTSAFTKVSDILNTKPNTFSNKRDFFDSHTNSKRVGWGKELSKPMQKVFDELKNLSKNEVIAIGKQILDRYQAK
jgi:hypothetical protein